MRINRGAYPVIKWGLIGVAAVAVVVGGIFGALYLTRDTNPIPGPLRQSLEFAPFTIPLGTPGYTTDTYSQTTSDDGSGTKVFTYQIHGTDGNTIYMSQYIQPSQFIDIPEYKDRFLTNIIKQYETVPTANGTVYLGRLTKQNNEQVGIMLERGLIVFLKPVTELDTLAWRRLAEALVIQKLD